MEECWYKNNPDRDDYCSSTDTTLVSSAENMKFNGLDLDDYDAPLTFTLCDLCVNALSFDINRRCAICGYVLFDAGLRVSGTEQLCAICAEEHMETYVTSWDALCERSNGSVDCPHAVSWEDLMDDFDADNPGHLDMLIAILKAEWIRWKDRQKSAKKRQRKEEQEKERDLKRRLLEIVPRCDEDVAERLGRKFREHNVEKEKLDGPVLCKLLLEHMT